MITIFTNPRPFSGPFDVIQRNAIRSWLELRPPCEILLFEDEEKTSSKIAREFGVQCISDVQRDEFGTPLLSDVFNKARKLANYDIVAQVNTDIILMSDFLKAVIQIKTIVEEKPFFMSGRRWNLEINEKIDFNEEWENDLHDKIKKEGNLHRLSGMDYWIFPSNLSFNPPPFVVGRPGIDSWLVYKARSLKIPVIDATEVATIVHQNHHYPQKEKQFFEIEKERNLKLSGGYLNLCTLRDADWLLTRRGLRKPPFPRRIFSALTLFYPWRLALSIKRRLENLLI